jgi:hypothetical protein
MNGMFRIEHRLDVSGYPQKADSQLPELPER